MSPPRNEGTPAGSGHKGHVFRLLRNSHIFSSAVRDIMEARYLREVSPHPLTLSQFHLLKLIVLNGHHQVGEVADFLGVSAPAACKNIDKLERLGLVARTESKGDRRATLLAASTKGRRLVRKYEEIRTARLAPVLEQFTTEEVEALSHLLERFAISLLKTEGSEDGLCLRCAAYWEEHCPVGALRGGCPYQALHGRHASADARAGTS